ncbi:hypothetical protein ACX9I7_01280 [Streptomyces sp. L500]
MTRPRPLAATRQATAPFTVTVRLPDTVPAKRLEPGDTFAFPEDDTPRTVLCSAPDPHHDRYRLYALDDDPLPMCMREDEPIRPVRLPRTFDLPCQLCGRTSRIAVDLAVHGEPLIRICDQH